MYFDFVLIILPDIILFIIWLLIILFAIRKIFKWKQEGDYLSLKSKLSVLGTITVVLLFMSYYHVEAAWKDVKNGLEENYVKAEYYGKYKKAAIPINEDFKEEDYIYETYYKFGKVAVLEGNLYIIKVPKKEMEKGKYYKIKYYEASNWIKEFEEITKNEYIEKTKEN